LRLCRNIIGKKSKRKICSIYFGFYQDGVELLVEVDVEAEPLEAGNEDDDEDPDVLYEANVMQDQRILDDDDVRVFSSRSGGKNVEQLKVVNPYVFSGEGDEKWKIPRAHRLKWKRIMNNELSKKDVMSDERAKMVSSVIMGYKGKNYEKHLLAYWCMLIKV